jgi:hypothetical protein
VVLEAVVMLELLDLLILAVVVERLLAVLVLELVGQVL